jgi:hypothetical protein
VTAQGIHVDESRLINILAYANAVLIAFHGADLECRMGGAGTYCRICELTWNFAMRFRKIPPIHRLRIACIRASQQVFKVMEF